MAIDKKLIDQLLTDYKKPEDIIGENGLLKELTKAILERALQAEMTDHLGYEKHDPAGLKSLMSFPGEEWPKRDYPSLTTPETYCKVAANQGARRCKLGIMANKKANPAAISPSWPAVRISESVTSLGPART
jgi:Transposase, Mutator family